LAKVRYVEAVVREEPVIAKRPYKGDPATGAEILVGSSGLLARVRYRPDKWPGVEKVNQYLEGCPLCRSLEAVYARQFNVTPLEQIEQETADRILSALAFKHRVPKPNLVLTDRCHEPGEGAFIEEVPPPPEGVKWTIQLCKGGLNLHVLLHEFRHYLSRLEGRPIDEDAAECYALQQVFGPGNACLKRSACCPQPQKSYKGDKRKVSHEGSSMRPIDLLRSWGPQHLAQGLERGYREVDVVTGRVGLKPHERPSFYLNLASAAGLGIGALMLKPPWDVVLAIWAGHHSTTLWDFLEEYVAGGGGGLSPKYSPTETPQYTPVKGEAGSVKATPTRVGRYRVVD